MAGTNRQAQRGAIPSAGQRRTRRLTRGAALCGVVIAAMLMAACGSSGGSPTAAGPGGHSGGNQNAAARALISARQLSGIGTVLVSRSGMTIYTPKSPAEINGNIKCTGSCTSFWIPVTGSSATASPSGLPGKLGTIQRPDGTTQLTYNGRPLYTFKLDTAAGQDHGSNFTDMFNGTTFIWQVVTASGTPGSAGAPAPSSGYNQPGY